ncbi:MAG: hypothetical protein ACYSUT_00315 [Planctomycetota bacterium]|jgi:hypothetical protein
MRAKDWFIIVFCLVIGTALLTLAETRTDSIHTAREEMGLVANASLENAPPSLAFATVAMGAFRGVIVDILWMRADTLKNEGKFFDAKQLAEWITTLQPRFAAVWDFHAWNMAYNISVAIPNTQPEERWRWVRNGYELLRDRAIQLNPNSILLYRSLAWIFQHKIAGISDDCHKYYKRELALAFRPLIDENTNEYFDKLAGAPETLAEIMADEEIAAFVEALQEADPVFLEKNKLVSNYLSLQQTPGRFPAQALEVIQTFRGSAAMDRFDVFTKAYQIRNVWKFDIDYMIELNKEFGPVKFEDPNNHMPLNWQHPATHSLYWGAMGLDIAGREGEYRVDEKNTDRIVFHALQLMFRSGKTVLYEKPGEEPQIFLLPDLQMFHSCDRAWRDVIKKYESLERSNPKAVRGGHKNFLENAVLTFYQAGHRKKAGQLYRRLQRDHMIDPAGFERAEYKVPFMTFLRERMKSEMEGVGPQDATEFIIGFLREGLYRFAMHEDDDAAGFENYAQEIYDVYMKDRATDPVERQRMGLASMKFMRYQAFMLFLDDPMYPESIRIGLVNRLKLEQPETFKQFEQQHQEVLDRLRRMQEESDFETP